MSTKLSIVMAYYENPGMLEVQLRNFAAMGKTAQRALSLVIVDDCSPTRPAAPVVASVKLGVELQLFRMQVDVPWNQDACRNLAMSHVTTKWAILTDMDHVVPETTILAILGRKLDPSRAYRFNRVTAPTLEPYKSHPNTWLLTRDMYDKIGGYDERYAGIYGTDGAFARGVARCATEVETIREAIIRFPREHVPDASTTTLPRKSHENHERKKAKDREIAAKVKDATGPHRGLFPWERVI